MTTKALTGFLFFLALACGAAALCHWTIRSRWMATSLAVTLTLGLMFVLGWDQLYPATPMKIGMAAIVALLAFIPVYLIDLLFARIRSSHAVRELDTSPVQTPRNAARIGEIALRHGLGGFFILSSVVAYREHSWVALAFHLVAFTLVSLPKKSAPKLRMAHKAVFSCVLWVFGIVLQTALVGDVKPNNALQPSAISAAELNRWASQSTLKVR